MNDFRCLIACLVGCLFCASALGYSDHESREFYVFTVFEVNRANTITANRLESVAVTIINNEATFASVYQALHGDSSAKYEDTEFIDFTTGTVLFVDLGWKASTGYAVNVNRIDRYRNDINIYVSSESPGAGCRVGYAETRPYQLVYIKKKVYDIKVQFNELLKPCD